MKYRIIHLLQKYYLNPPIKVVFAIGVAPPGYALLETTGRKTGKPRRTPVGDGRVGPVLDRGRARNESGLCAQPFKQSTGALETAPWGTCALA
jgi:F420H(2)-dependent quinone reductase